MITQIPLLTVPDYEARARETMPMALFGRLFGTCGAPIMTSNTNNPASLRSHKAETPGVGRCEPSRAV